MTSRNADKLSLHFKRPVLLFDTLGGTISLYAHFQSTAEQQLKYHSNISAK